MSESYYPEAPILLVDDEKNALRSYELALLSAGINNIISCPDGAKAREIIKSREVELVVLDMIMPNISGAELLSEVTRDFPDVPVIMATCVNNLTQAVECMRLGAMDYLVKPIDMEKLIGQVRNCLEIRDLKRENYRLQQRLLLGNPMEKSFLRMPCINCPNATESWLLSILPVWMIICFPILFSDIPKERLQEQSVIVPG
jgi:DNA-binding NtrC family response regulator